MPEHTALTVMTDNRRADCEITNRLRADLAIGAD